MKKVITTSFDETQKLGIEFAKQVKEGGVLALYGDLGSGKTTFVQGLAKGLGITKKIISPTFIIMRTYDLDGRGEKADGRSSSMFYHVDLYRIESEHDVEGLGLIELINDPKNIIVIEWPEKIGKLLPSSSKKLKFTYLDDDTREIMIDGQFFL